ncbi:MAG: SDR family oxidoreductase [Solirubrobacteraceae bacterium]|nr:SDR family oxidoreductase [Solirubrobacteraceae bacterium]
MAVLLDGAVVCVTGAARGIGRATASALADRGARVWIGDLDLEEAEASAAEIGRGARAAQLDVTDAASFARFLGAVEGDGPLAMLVNNAGIMRVGPFLDQRPAGQHQEIAVNLGGVVNGMRLALPGMVERDHGHVVNVASMAAKMTTPGAAVYSASKFAVAALSRAVRAEIAESAVTISTVMPSAVRTELITGLQTRGVPTLDPEDVAAAIVASAGHPRREITLPRWLAPVGATEQAVPERLLEFAKRNLGGNDTLAADDPERQAYEGRHEHVG